MNQLQQFIRSAQAYGYLLLVLSHTLITVIWWICAETLGLDPRTALGIAAFLALLLPLPLIWGIERLFTRPLRFVWQAIMYILPTTTDITAPDTKKVRYARDLILNLVGNVYKLADASEQLAAVTTQVDTSLQRNFVANSLPLPLVVLDQSDNVLFANNAFLKYINKTSEEVVSNSIYSSLDLSFTTVNTLDNWLAHAKENAATAQQAWERVKLTLPGDEPQARLLDLAAYYNKGNPSGYESMLVLFDHTEAYSQDDQAISFVALAVHELRTPLTMLRGYIEVLEEELDGKLNEELARYMRNMQASAQQLSTFVNNILNVARIEEDQMFLRLQEGDWSTLLRQTVEDLSLRAQVQGITLKTAIPDNLPKVGVDTISLYEVMSNLVDNAIKYSGNGKEILISASVNQNGFVETTVQDYGVGIPESAVPRIFQKFYRDHHNRQQVGGTGMGLFLCKTIVNAHGGNIWVRTKEGEGSTFGFSLVPFAQLAEELKSSDNKDIVRNAHGWIKNHSLYRR